MADRTCSKCRDATAVAGQRWCRACLTASMRGTRARHRELRARRFQASKIPCSRCGELRRPERMKQVGWLKPFIPRVLCGRCRQALFSGYLPNRVDKGTVDRRATNRKFA